MQERFQALAAAMRKIFGRAAEHAGSVGGTVGGELRTRGRGLMTALAASALVGGAAYYAYTHPPMVQVERGEVALRRNRWSGEVDEAREGSIWALPGVHEVKTYSLRDRVYHADDAASAAGAAPFQTVEGLSIGLDVSVRYALDPTRIAAVAKAAPEDIDRDLVAPMVKGVLYRTLAQYTVREIYSAKRQAIQGAIEEELKKLFDTDGLKLQSVMIGKVDLPPDYKAGMERLLAEELATEKMRYTLELLDKQVKQSELEATAEKVRREKRAEASASEQIIAAQAQAEAMKHVLPFKQKQIEQRQLEAEAEKITRVKNAEAASQARQIEATGEAESRRKLADAEAYRQERLAKIASEQLARDGAVISKNPLLVQKALADKLSDKISVIIAPPPTDGGFIGANLIGATRRGAGKGKPAADDHDAEGQD